MRNPTVLLAAVALAAVISVGCSKPEPAAQTPAPKTATTASIPIYKNDKGQITCPVTGEVIKSEKDAAGYQDYKGVRYYFCCGMCPPKFSADPDKYVVRHELEKM